MAVIQSRRNLILGAGFVLASGGAFFSKSAQAADSQDPTGGRKLVFDDSFDRIDPLVWNAGPKATSGPSGFYGRSAFSRIGGEEHYNPYEIVDDAATDNGKALQISAKYLGKKMNIPNYYGNNDREFQWVSGNIQTAKSDGTILQGWRNGYFEARLLFPVHPLTFPAFWLLNARSILQPETSIEIDVVEQKGTEPSLYGAYLHEWGKPGEHHEGTGVPTTLDMTTGYRRYGVLIEGSRCRLYFERKPVVDAKTKKPVDWLIGRGEEMDSESDVFWPLLTLALRSDVKFPNPLLPADEVAHMRIDYLRVYT
ncbi:glycoside hydrolase family 16 protein [Rhizobium tumorigenes]|uniref:glycoside hydrolase family 16 protein n=1 Tax=Rhizobium tumorigenes TaxID=2041385 RepID=UPI00241CBC77|nr:family 16 glycosylhydrolase [Rhizobium tumorigenes]WFS03309.1 family 16 glycosylhydrolase [Rhizobium tumorigenes]